MPSQKEIIFITSGSNSNCIFISAPDMFHISYSSQHFICSHIVVC